MDFVNCDELIVCLMVFNATFNNISVISLWSVLLVEETRVPGEHHPGADPGFQVRGAHLKKLRRTEGGAKIFGVFRVRNHDFTPKNHIFSNFRGGARRVPWIRPCHRPAASH